MERFLNLDDEAAYAAAVSPETGVLTADAVDAVGKLLAMTRPISGASSAPEALAAGRIGSMPDRFYGAYNNYSQRKVLEEEAPKVLEYCRADNIDVAVTVPV